MMASNSIKKSKIIKYLGFVSLLIIIFFSLIVFITIRNDKIFFLQSQDVIKVNNSLDSLFKDYVYLPIVENSRGSGQFEKDISEEIDTTIFHFETLLSSQFPSVDIAHEISKKWNLLQNSSDIEKLNLLYDLEILHNLIDRNETELISKRLQTSNDKNLILLLFIVFFGFLSVLMIYFFGYYTTKEINQIQMSLNESQNSTKNMSKFLALAGHELRTPLNGIIGLAQILRNSFLPELETHYADNIYHSGKSLLKITNYILDYSNNVISEIKLENVEFSLNTIIQQVIVTFYTEALEKKIEFKYLIDEDVPLRIHGDPTRLLQVLYSLIGNAVRSTMNGVIVFRIKVISKSFSSGVCLYFAIKDSGAGFSEEDLQELFLPFSEIQILGKLNEIYPVLSFAFCRQIVNAMKGEFKFKTKEGEGTEFSFTASFTQFSEEKLKDYFLKESNCCEDHFLIKEIFDKSFKPTILIVDDDPANLLMIQAMLERLGASILKASNGQEAINVFAKTRIDLVLMDCQMPVMDGYEATKIVRKYNAQVPILAMGASLTVEDQSKCLKSGMNGFISKPIEIENLIINLKKFLEPDPGSISDEDFEQLEKNKGHKGMIEFLQKFVKDLQFSIEEINQSLINNDLDSIHKISKNIKSSSKLVGAKGLTHLFIELENVKNIQKAVELKNQIDLGTTSLKKKITEHFNFH